MTAINKQFTKLGETFTVDSENKAHGKVVSYNCRSHEDNKLWVFSYEEVRRVLESQT